MKKKKKKKKKHTKKKNNNKYKLSSKGLTDQLLRATKTMFEEHIAIMSIQPHTISNATHVQCDRNTDMTVDATCT